MHLKECECESKCEFVYRRFLQILRIRCDQDGSSATIIEVHVGDIKGK